MEPVNCHKWFDAAPAGASVCAAPRFMCRSLSSRRLNCAEAAAFNYTAAAPRRSSAAKRAGDIKKCKVRRSPRFNGSD